MGLIFPIFLCLPQDGRKRWGQDGDAGASKHGGLSWNQMNINVQAVTSGKRRLEVSGVNTCVSPLTT